MRRLLALAATVAIGLGGSAAAASYSAASHAASAATGPTLVTITVPAVHGKIPAKWLDHPGLPEADVLLPAGYDPSKRYPLLFLLHGLGGSYAFYQQQGLLPELYHLDAIVVMPDGGPAGWYADWWNDGERGDPSWETYELDDVLPAIMHRFPIRAGRRWHAIAGISMGGLGAAYLGGRLPGFFGTVASLSGFVDPQLLGTVVQPAMAAVTNGFLSGPRSGRDKDPVPIYGPPDGFYATGHNPRRLAANLRQTRVYLTTGNGIPDLASVGVILAGFTEEIVDATWEEAGLIYPMSERYYDALNAAGVNVTYQVHFGGHDLPSFHKELQALLSWGLFKPVPTHPAAWTNATVATSGKLWNVGYRFASPPTAVVTFRRAGDRLTISAAGTPVTVAVGECVIRVPTPATVRIFASGCNRGRLLAR
ncbi:MAG TPA: alpha/beta hydrolase-fold protein [Mycobacteriales bacterium]|nr:alpha/beta hydrolase-fold protein [Mycobacteriales bacterium]